MTTHSHTAQPAPGVSLVVQRLSYAAVAAVVTFGIGVRIAGVFTDFWMDEVVSYYLVRQCPSFADILLTLHNDNNHPLNSGFMYLLGPERPWPSYRALALATGILTIVLAPCWYRSRPRAAACFCLLAGPSYILTVYASEARGYAPMLICALLCVTSIERFHHQPRWRWAILYLTSLTIGLTAHLTIIHAYAGTFAWSAAHVLHRRSRAEPVMPVVALHAISAMIVGAYYLIFARHLPPASGPTSAYLDIVVSTLSLTAGGPMDDNGTAGIARATALLAGIAFVAAVNRSRRRDTTIWVFYVTAVVGSPLLLILALRPEVLFVRYFLISVVFIYHLLAIEIADVLTGTEVTCVAEPHRPTVPRWRFMIGLLLIAGIAGNVANIRAFIGHGRGQYLDALRYMEQQTAGNIVRVGSDHDIRNSLLLSFYSTHVRKAIDYVTIDRLRRQPPDWFIVHGANAPPPKIRESANGVHAEYVFDRTFPGGGLSGWPWHLYRLNGQASTP